MMAQSIDPVNLKGLLLHSGPITCVCPGADAASLFNLDQSHLGGPGPTSGPEHPAASDRGLRHPLLHCGAHCRARCQLWYTCTHMHTRTHMHMPESGAGLS